MDDLERVLRTHPFLDGMSAEHVRVLVGCARTLRFRAGEFLVREGDPEGELFLLRQGVVTIEVGRVGSGETQIETLGPGDVLGVSLLTARPAHLDCRARETVLAFSLDHVCLRAKMSADPALGFDLTARLLERTYERLARARMQNVDMFR